MLQRQSGRFVFAFALLMTLLAGLTPVGRVMRRAELSYNEGWNVAGAMRLTPGAATDRQLPRTTGAAPLESGCCQTELYPAAWGWTTVNYPVLSFALMAGLHRLTGEYLFTGRVVSLLSLAACAVLLANIARALGATRRAGWLTGLLCFATFCVAAVDYAGVDDPQMLGDALFLAALLVYVRRPVKDTERLPATAAEPGYGAICGAALLFAVAVCVKQSPIDFPIAVLLDLLLLNRRKAAWFCVCGGLFGAVAIWLNVRAGGPWFVQELLLGRIYLPGKAVGVAVSVLGPMCVPLLVAGVAAFRFRNDPRRRIAAILLVVSVGVGGYFGGGSGVAGNALFTALFATVLLAGLAMGDAEQAAGGGGARVLPDWPWTGRFAGRGAEVLTVVLFGWLVTPALVQHIADPAANLREAAAAERRFTAETDFLRSRPGPALCESMLRCLSAGKPYVFDPFNATRLMLQGRLQEAALVDEIDRHQYAAIQMHTALAVGVENDGLMRERFTVPVLRAIDRSYTLAMRDEDTAVYVPRR